MMQPNNYRIDEAKYKSLLKYIRLSVTEKYEFPPVSYTHLTLPTN